MRHVNEGNIDADPLFVDPDGSDDIVGTALNIIFLAFRVAIRYPGVLEGVSGTSLSSWPRPSDPLFGASMETSILSPRCAHMTNESGMTAWACQ